MYWQRFLIGATVAILVLAGCSNKEENAFRRADYNKDGKIIFEELIVVFPDLSVEEFLAADANHDGSIDEQEFRRFDEARRAGKRLKAPAETPASAAQRPADTAKPAPVTPPQPSASTSEVTPQPSATSSPAAKTDADVTPSVPSPASASASAPATSPAPATPGAPTAPAEHPAASNMPVASTTPTAPAKPIVVTAPAPAAAAAPQTYVVARGDTMTRIARRFKVSVVDLMAVNGMKNADHLEAGATIKVPSSESSTAMPASPTITAFVRDFFTQSADGDVNALIDLYADRVAYYKKGRSGRDIVRQDKVTYFLRWPKRTYTPGQAMVTPVSGSDDLRVAVPVDYTVANGTKHASGQALFTFLLQPQGTTYRIVGEHSVITRRN